jgi:hypothetical protein
LKNRDIRGIAIDTPSIDYGRSKDFKVRQILCAADKLALENIANLDPLPAVGAMLYVIPMLIKDGTGAPGRVYAILPWDKGTAPRTRGQPVHPVRLLDAVEDEPGRDGEIPHLSFFPFFCIMLLLGRER